MHATMVDPIGSSPLSMHDGVARNTKLSKNITHVARRIQLIRDLSVSLPLRARLARPNGPRLAPHLRVQRVRRRQVAAERRARQALRVRHRRLGEARHLSARARSHTCGRTPLAGRVGLGEDGQ